ncbi:hypothetical protein AGRA3207_001824 [Actinomadura graeca]|uniref:Uncharacterized protein n=1 Tax=Actinomadura graeca TaxID=2750812 RepID=A0ABX8QQU9_9ACTN|nr:hypothetical protein [Actinomadura graeca]QXJ21018.1 hypothetical protein AGRA3207_001824 [Actinomadura graeca]
MGQAGMRITVDAAMRARDISRPRPAGTEPAGTGRGDRPSEPAGPATAAGTAGARNGKAAKNERRRLGKRGGTRKPAVDGGA